MKNKILTWLGIVAAMGVLAVAVTFGMLELADNPVDKEVSAQIDKKEDPTIVGREVDGVFVKCIMKILLKAKSLQRCIT